MELFIGTVECPPDVDGGFPRAGDPRDKIAEATQLVQPSVRNHTLLLAQHPAVTHRIAVFSVREEWAKQRIAGVILDAGGHASFHLAM